MVMLAAVPSPAAEAPAPEPPAARRGAAEIRIDIPVRLGRQPLGDVPAVFSPRDELLFVDGAAFVRLLDTYLLPEIQSELLRRAGTGGRLSPAAIRTAGVGVNFDQGRAEIVIDLPPEMQTVRALS